MKKLIKAVMLAFREGSCTIDRAESRSRAGHEALRAVLEFLVETEGYTWREARNTLVMEAVRVASLADADEHRKNN